MPSGSPVDWEIQARVLSTENWTFGVFLHDHLRDLNSLCTTAKAGHSLTPEVVALAFTYLSHRKVLSVVSEGRLKPHTPLRAPAYTSNNPRHKNLTLSPDPSCLNQSGMQTGRHKFHLSENLSLQNSVTANSQKLRMRKVPNFESCRRIGSPIFLRSTEMATP